MGRWGDGAHDGTWGASSPGRRCVWPLVASKACFPDGQAVAVISCHSSISWSLDNDNDKGLKELERVGKIGSGSLKGVSILEARKAKRCSKVHINSHQFTSIFLGTNYFACAEHVQLDVTFFFRCRSDRTGTFKVFASSIYSCGKFQLARAQEHLADPAKFYWFGFGTILLVDCELASKKWYWPTLGPHVHEFCRLNLPVPQVSMV